jgi:transposase
VQLFAIICTHTPAVLTTLIMTAKLNDVDSQAWLADVLARIAEQPASRLGDLLP